MIPIQLTIEGLYSYQNRQIIDFSRLTEAGLFGIFGAVGSGKSSILEAITFALYGETERLNAKDRRSYNMMNLKSDRAYIAFDFLNYENKQFRATREFKRNSKRFEDIKTVGAAFYEWIDNTWIPLQHSKAEEIIGLSYENFKRTIIIPQGQFKEFIELGAKDRTQMMKEIFNLHHFDLQEKVSKLNNKNLTALNQLEGKLSGYDEVSEEKINQLSETLTEEQKIVLDKKQLFDTANEKLQQLKALKTDFENLENKKSSFTALSHQKPIIDAQKASLELYERIFKVFYQLLTDIDKTEKNIKTLSVQAENEEKQLKISESNLTEISEKINEIKPYFERLPQKRLESADLELISEVIHFQSEINELKIRTSKGSAKVSEVERAIKMIVETIKESEEKMVQLHKQQIDTDVLMNVGNWFIHQQNLLKNSEIQQGKINQLIKEIEQISKELTVDKISVADFENNVKIKNLEFLSLKKQLDEKRRSFEVQQELSHFAHNLQHGESCPLCGSLEHPSIIVLDDVTLNLNEIKTESERLENQHNHWIDFTEKIRRKIQKLSLVEEQLSMEKTTAQNIENQLLKHQSLFVWSGFRAGNPEDFEQKRNNSLEIGKEIETKNRFIANQRMMLENEREKVEKFKNALEQFKLDETKKETQIKQNLSNLKVLNYIDFRHFSVDEIKQKLNDLKAFNEKTEHDFNQLSQTFNQLNNQISVQKTTLELTQKQLANLITNLQALNSEFDQHLTEQNLPNKEKVSEILNKQWEIEAVKKQIEEFTIVYKTLENQIAELEQKLENVSFNTEEFQQYEQQFSILKTELEQATENVTKTNTEVQRLTKAYKEKQELQTALNQLQKRAENLRTLTNLFKGAGFVQYVSSVYLKQLCENANIRFHRMTKNQLSLQINENNDFEIVDYLNEGRARSVKTLSGGQSFQVSLSLALALAESVQVHSKAEKNFFFIDEGFGTQDAEAVNTVFETLHHLHKENRIVGIISHVEELKERMPVSLSVIKNEETGSQISISE